MNSSAIRQPTAHLVSLATAVPDFDLPQDEVARRAGELFAPMVADFTRLTPIYRNAEIEQRHSCVPIDWYSQPHSFGDRNALFLTNATDLLVEAAEKALAEAGLAAEDIDTVITICSTGIATPSLDARLIGRLGLRSDVQRLPVFGLGCAAGVSGLGIAARMAKSRPGAVVLFVAIELCSLAFRLDELTRPNIVATALFGDGAAACILRAGKDGLAEIESTGEHLFPDTLGIMGWKIDDTGFGIILDQSLPPFAEANIKPAVAGILERAGLTISDVDRFICHPGGTKVLVALETAFGLEPGSLDIEREVVGDYGNMSSPTVLFILDRLLERGLPDKVMMTAFGPGFTCAGMLLEAA